MSAEVHLDSKQFLSLAKSLAYSKTDALERGIKYDDYNPEFVFEIDKDGHLLSVQIVEGKLMEIHDN